MDLLHIKLIGAHISYNIMTLDKSLHRSMLGLKLILLIQELLNLTSDWILGLFFFNETRVKELHIRGLRNSMKFA